VVWLRDDPFSHPLLAGLGPEPLTDGFSADYLVKITRRRKVAIKLLLMNSRLVVGVGNIYANEALFRARINPGFPAGELSMDQCSLLARSVKEILAEAIARGEKTLDNFLSVTERPVYFPLEAQVYGRGGESCPVCGTPLRQEQLGGRATVWCPNCQPAPHT
jgi:formamidopyrimidine-DNA glycosylase